MIALYVEGSNHDCNRPLGTRRILAYYRSRKGMAAYKTQTMIADIISGVVGIAVGSIFAYVATKTCWFGLWHWRFDGAPCLLCGR